MIWYGILTAVFLLEAAFIAVCRRREAVRGTRTRRVWIGPVIALACLAGISVWSLSNAAIVLLHLCVFLFVGMCVDGVVSLVLRRRAEREAEASAENEKKAAAGREGSSCVWIAAFVACALWLGLGFCAAHHVWRTEYPLTTDKPLTQESLRIAQISDSHIGVTMDADGFAKKLKSVMEEKPDLVVITGDFTDESTTREDMLGSCRALGELQTKYGVYFVFGNHDCSDDGDREFTVAELEVALRLNGVVVLRDEVKLVADDFYIVGRRDTSESRKSIAELMETVDTSRYVIVLDHQPGDFPKEAAAGADLVLTGHTHGGQLMPLGLMARMLPMVFGDAEFLYGQRMYGTTACIVSSGMSSWEFRFKTGTVSEYVIVDVKTGK
ncbi:MAG: metallophosphoesterase [Lachnospiraceae bacterium]|nr:metallophosphoesterase [Lachnospiraceae bacterium]